MRTKVRRFHGPDEFDGSNSLQQLEGEDWGEPTYHTYLVKDVIVCAEFLCAISQLRICA